jgi:hypothetical protein
VRPVPNKAHIYGEVSVKKRPKLNVSPFPVNSRSRATVKKKIKITSQTPYE